MTRLFVPEGIIGQNEFSDILCSLGIDASSRLQHVKQDGHGDNWLESDSLGCQHLHPTLFSVHENNGICHLIRIDKSQDSFLCVSVIKSIVYQ